MRIGATALLTATVLTLLAAGPAVGQELDMDKVNRLVEEGKALHDKSADTTTSLRDRQKAGVAALKPLKEAYDILDKWCDEHQEDAERLEDLMVEISGMRFWIKKFLPANMLPDEPENRAAPQQDWPDEPPEDLHKPALPPGTPQDPNAKPIPPGPSVVARNLERVKEYEKDHPWDHPGICDLYLDILDHALPGSPEFAYAIRKYDHYNSLLKDAYRRMRNADPDELKNTGAESRRLVHHLSKDLKDKHPDVRLRAAEYLARLGNGDAARHLVAALKKEREEAVVDAMFESLKKIGGKKTMEQVGSMRKWRKEEMARRAIELLSQLAARDEVEGRNASITLGLFVLNRDKKIAREALDALMAIGPAGTLGLINCVVVQDYQLKIDVIRALGKSGDGRAGAGLGPLLMGGVKGDLAKLRDEAFEACKQIGKPIVPYLAPFVEGGRPFWARRALMEITGRSFKSKGEVMRWWEKNK